MNRILPLIGFAALFAIFGFGIWWNSTHVSNYVPSPLIDKPAPEFSLPRLDQPDVQVTRADLLGQAWLMNVWGSWCFACGQEHPVLMDNAGRLGVPIVGYNYRDAPTDAMAWLTRWGDPYDLVIVDFPGDTAIDFGIYGAPETFLIDRHGVIRYKHIGPLTEEVLAAEVRPIIATLAAADPAAGSKP